MKNKKNCMEHLTAESILAERAQRKLLQDELERLQQEAEHSETSEEDEVLKEYSFKVSSCSEANDINFIFKNHGHPIFNKSVNLNEDVCLSQMDENDRYLFKEMLSHQFWNKISSHFANRPYDIQKLIFTLMTSSSKYAGSCKQYLSFISNSWAPSYADIVDAILHWGASPDCLKIEDKDLVDSKMECGELLDSDPQNSFSMSGTPCTPNMNVVPNSFKMSDEEIELIILTLDYLSVSLAKSTMKPMDTLNLVCLLLRISVDENCMQALASIGRLVSVLLNSLPIFADVMVNKLAYNLLQFETDVVNKVFISTNVIPKSPRGQQLATCFSFLIIQDILKIETQAELKNLQPILKIFHENGDKVKLLNPAQIYFFVLSLTNILYGLDVNFLDIDELSAFLEYIYAIRKLPQIQKRGSNLKFISNFVEWCVTFYRFSRDERKELQRFESPKKKFRFNFL